MRGETGAAPAARVRCRRSRPEGATHAHGGRAGGRCPGRGVSWRRPGPGRELRCSPPPSRTSWPGSRTAALRRWRQVPGGRGCGAGPGVGTAAGPGLGTAGRRWGGSWGCGVSFEGERGTGCGVVGQDMGTAVGQGLGCRMGEGIGKAVGQRRVWGRGTERLSVGMGWGAGA